MAHETEIGAVEFLIRHLIEQVYHLLQSLESSHYDSTGFLQRGQLGSFGLESGRLTQDTLAMLQHLVEGNGAYLKSVIPPLPAMLQGLECLVDAINAGLCTAIIPLALTILQEGFRVKDDALYGSQDKGMYRLCTLPVGPAARAVRTKIVGAAQPPARCDSHRTNVGHRVVRESAAHQAD